MPKRKTRAERQAETRQALIDSAAALFARRGYEATTLEQISERVGLTRGAVYANFRGKEDLLFAVVERAAQIFDSPTAFGDRTKPLAERIRTYAHELVRDWRHVREALLLYFELEMLAMRNNKVRARLAAVTSVLAEARGSGLDQDAAEQDIALPLSGAQMLIYTGAAIRGLMRERMLYPDLIDEQLLTDAMLIMFGCHADVAR